MRSPGEEAGSPDAEAGAEDKENQRVSVSSDGLATIVDQGRALLDVAVEVPQEYKEHPFSDVESSSGSSEFESENLAEQLAERVHQNVDDRYDFEVFVDPENRL